MSFTEIVLRSRLKPATSSPVACLSISLASSWLLAGTEAGTVQIYDVLSHQFLRSISAHQDKGLRITTLATMLKPLDLLGHVSLNLGAGVKEGCGVYPKPVMPFMKMKDAKARDKKEVWMMISDGNDGDSGDHQGLRESIIQEQSFFIRNKTAAEGADNSSSTEVISLLEQLGRAKAINDSMWERIVQKVVLEGKSKESDSGAEQLAEDERSRKRSRS